MLPPEIVDHILSFLEDDTFTLKKCVEGCPEIAEIVERRLFANITVCNAKSYYPPHIIPWFKLVELLSNRGPHIANYVRSITIKVTIPTFFRGQYILDVETVSKLHKLQRLEKVCLASAYENRPVAWSKMHENIRAAFLTLLRSPTLKEVSIWGVEEFPLSVFDEFQNITRLRLRASNSDTWVQSPSCPPLDFLSLASCPPTIIPWVRSRALRALDFRVDDPDMFRQILQACSNTLIRLNVNLNSHFNTHYDLVERRSSPASDTSFNLSAFSKLQQLDIHASMWFTVGFFVRSTGDDTLESRHYSSPLPAIIQTLLTLPSSCPLKLVTLHFDISQNSDFDLSEIDWSPLFSPSLFSTIHHIDLRIGARTGKGKSVPPFKIISSLAVNAQLMEMVEQGLLMVTVEENEYLIGV